MFKKFLDASLVGMVSSKFIVNLNINKTGSGRSSDLAYYLMQSLVKKAQNSSLWELGVL